MDNLQSIFMKLPGELGIKIKNLPDHLSENMEEIRIKIGQPIFIYSGGKEFSITNKENSVDKDFIGNIFNSLLKHSAYAFQEEISKGYITIEGGHRVGICGKAVVEKGEIKSLKDISSINIRRSKELLYISNPCMNYILKSSRKMYNTLIVSPPKCGKTTLLRDFIRNLSNMGFKVGLCDERSEVSGVCNGVSNYDLGSRTDVLLSCPKQEGMMMLIRSMSPDIIATDEIGKKEDVFALESALCAGIGILTTIHGSSYNDLLNSGIKDLIKSGFFERLIYLSNDPATGTIQKICNGKGELL